MGQWTRLLGPNEIDGLPVSPGKAYTLLTDHLITGKPFGSEPAKKCFQVKPSMHISRFIAQSILIAVYLLKCPTINNICICIILVSLVGYFSLTLMSRYDHSC